MDKKDKAIKAKVLSNSDDQKMIEELKGYLNKNNRKLILNAFINSAC